MRIDNNPSVERVQSVRPKKVTRTEAASAGSVDSVEFSARAQDVSAAMDAIRTTPAVREDLVAQLKQQIADGSFDYNVEGIAEKLLGKGK